MNDREIFIQAPEECSPEELVAYLDEACGDDVALRQRVERMFAAASELGNFMGDPEVHWSAIRGEEVLEELASGELAGTAIGNYRLVEEIGRGGFGVVYRAEQQQPIRREVALKILKAGMDTRQVIKRFEAERQALAMMDHPNIAKVLDAGSTDSGRPFFVMELVHGCPITKFCDDRRLDTAGRLELFIDVCHAVQHAHQKGIIHRDLKPSNVMVSDGDDRPTVKVIDFGVAKATQVELGEQTVYTRVGQFIGTPAYMSPEQAGTGGGDIDTRSDIYSLGVLLYELLTGSTPFEAKQLAGLGEDELRRMIRETEPPRPSTRVRSSLQADVKRSDRNGHADPSALQGDLDWIVLMAIEKDRERRYQTVNGLAMDIRRHLEDEPVTAAAPSAIYRFRKYARRHRKVLVPTAVVALALLVGSLISLWQAADARRARRLAEGNARESQYRVADQLLAADSQDLGLAQLVQLAREQSDDPVAAQRIVSALSYRDFPELVRPVGSPIRGLRLTRAPKFIQDGRKIVSAVAQKGEVRVWDLTSDDPRQSDLVKDLPGSVEMLDLSKNETRIAVPQPSVGKGGQIVILDLGTGEVIRELSRLGIAWCRFSPSGDYLMSWGNFGGNKRLWNLEDGTDFPVPTGSGSPVANIESNSAAFSPDEKRIVAVGGGDSIAYIWEVEDVAQGKSVDRALQLPHGGTIWWVEFSPDGKYVVTASGDHTAQVWDAETGERQGAAMQHAGKVSQASFSPDGTIVATTSSDRSARLWDADTGQPLSSPMVHDDFVQWCAFNRTGSRLVTTGGAGRAHVWDVGTGRQVGGDFRHGEHVVSVAFSPDGERILTTTLGDAAALWKTPASRPGGAILRHLHRHEVLRANGMVNGGGFSKDGSRVITASRHDGVQLWDAETGLPLGRKLIRDDWGYDAWAAMGEDARYLVATERSRGIRLWQWEANVGDWSTAKVLRDNGDYRYTEFSPDGKRFLTSGSKVVEVWDLVAVMAEIDRDTTIEPVWTSPKAKGSAPSGLTRAYWARFSPDGNRVVGRTDENSVQVWDIVENKPGVILRHDGIVESVAFGPDGLRVATGSHDWTAMVWDAATGERLLPSPLRHSGSVNFVQFSPDGTKVLTASSDGTARLWDSSTGEPLPAAPLHHDGPVSMAIFSPDGTRVATASVDGSARLWDTLTGLPVSEIFRHGSWVRFVAFSPGGDRLLTSGNDGTARIWEVPTVELPVPTWFLDWAEAVVGSHMENDVATPMDWNRRQEIAVAVKERSGSGFYDQITAWYYGDPTSRAITPFSDITLPEYVASELEAGTAESLEEAARVAPDNVDALYHLAKKLWDDHSGMDPGARRRAAYYARQALARTDETAATEEPEPYPAGLRESRGALRRRACLLEWAGRAAEAAELLDEVTAIPPRDHEVDPRQIDLTAHYNDSLFGTVEPDRNSASFWMERLAELFDPGDGPDFDIRAKIQLNGGRYGPEQGNNAGKDFSEISKSECPMKVEGIAVGQSAVKIHFLLGCSWGREALGVQVAHFTLRYEDGSRSDPIPVTYGKDVVDLWVHSRPKEEVGGVENIAWEHPFRTWDGGEGRLALTRKTWENKEYPGRVISHIDFESAGKQAAPFLVAITVE